MRIDILDICIGNRLRILTSQGLVTGVVIDIMTANTRPDVQKVLTYYQIDKDHKHFKAFCRVIKLDRLVIKKDDSNYFILPRTNKADRYLLDIQKVN